MISQKMQKLAEWFDDAVRHRGVLGRHEGLRNLLRKPYHRLINFHGRGLSVKLGGSVSVRLPPEFRSKLMEEYEREEFAAIGDWCAKNSGGLFVDVGCSQGYMSCAALFASTGVDVIAIDSDANSLKCAQRVCQYADTTRLHPLCCLVAPESDTVLAWREASARTVAMLEKLPGRGDPGSHQYITLDDANATGGIPRHTLDDLLAAEIATPRNVLIKCDVEGAEYEVILGAEKTMAKLRPQILLSVHPPYLPRFHRDVAQLRALLESRGYSAKLLARDHEEHWLCLPVTSNVWT